MLTEKAGKFFAEGRERKSQAGPTLVAARGADADERAAGGANFRPGLLFAAAKKSARRVFPLIHAPLPFIGKRQFSSLQLAKGVPIIPERDCGLPAPEEWTRGYHGPIRRVRQTHR